MKLHSESFQPVLSRESLKKPDPLGKTNEHILLGFSGADYLTHEPLE